jgi:hypothetical protein
VVTRLGRWLCPALFGPLFAIWIYVTLAVLLGDVDPKLGRWGTWLLGMIFGTLVGGGIGIVLILVDAVLLRARKRLLPMGPRAWLMGLAAPFCIGTLWHLWRPGAHDGFLLGLAIAAPILAVAVALRLAFSPRLRAG